MKLFFEDPSTFLGVLDTLARAHAVFELIARI